MDLAIDSVRTAVLCMDVQNFTTAHLPGDARERLLGNIQRVLATARKTGTTVIYVVAARRPDFSSRRNKFISARAGAVGSPSEAAERMKIVDAIAPMGDEPIVRKPRMSGFYGSELQSLLMARDIDTVVLTGVATNFVVESTARYAVDCDYQVIVLEDCCTAGKLEDHQRAIESMTPLVHIASADDFIAGLH
jgi:nicotinamidase-related amidase